MPKIEWTPALHVGVAEIDQQHEKLIGLLNTLYDAHTQGKAKEVLQDVVSEVHDYISYHFETEQGLMDKYGYPGQEDHEEEHDNFILKSSDHLQDCADDKEDLTSEVVEFLTGWWAGHINGTDRKLAGFLKEKGVA